MTPSIFSAPQGVSNNSLRVNAREDLYTTLKTPGCVFVRVEIEVEFQSYYSPHGPKRLQTLRNPILTSPYTDVTGKVRICMGTVNTNREIEKLLVRRLMVEKPPHLIICYVQNQKLK